MKGIQQNKFYESNWTYERTYTSKLAWDDDANRLNGPFYCIFSKRNMMIAKQQTIFNIISH